jgi:rare lipoprotein A
MTWMKIRRIVSNATPAVLALLLAACALPRPTPPTPVHTPHPVFDEYEETGEASWYGHPYHGRRTASGEIFDMYQMTAAHRTLPFGTWVLVENSANGQSVKVRINDRGPFRSRRILDVSYAAARALGALGPGVIPVRLRVIASSGATRVGGRWAIPQGEGESP